MKKILLILVATLFLACGASKVVITSKKAMKGNWTLSSVTYNETGKYNISLLLNDASKACFEGSTWQFIPNNNTGIYSINGSGCQAGDRNFVFTIQEIDETTGLYDFLLKPTDAKNKSETNAGFRLKLNALSETAMQWQQTVMVEGKPFTINMNFLKQ